jgi:type IV secretory pathway VirJ component
MVRLLLILLLVAGLKASAITVDSLTYKQFGKITLYHPKGVPNSVALFVSGDGGWNHGVLNMAKDIANQGALVLGIDARHYGYYLSKKSGDCLYPAADFEELSLFIQKKYKFPNYYKPVLIGYSYGAVLVYGILAQAPANTFKGAIALGFSPDINLKKPLCKGTGLTQHLLKPGTYYLERTNKLSAPFIVLNGTKDLTCPYAASAAFLKGMPMTELIRLENVGHGFSIANNWLPKFNAAYKKIIGASSFVVQKVMSNMPVTVVPATQRNNLPLVFMISGDGGWTSFDESLAKALAADGLTVIGLDAQKYFWNTRTPNGTTEDVIKVLQQYRVQTGKQNFVLAGYSFGASVVPFIASRLPGSLKSNLTSVVSLSPDEFADFEIHIADMLDIGNDDEQYDVIAEFRKISLDHPTCLFGASEDGTIPEKFKSKGIKVQLLPGSHHYNEDYAAVSKAILQAIAANNKN